MELDEVNLNFVLEALSDQIKLKNWDVTNLDEKAHLKAVMNLHEDILAYLDGSTSAVEKVTKWVKG